MYVLLCQHQYEWIVTKRRDCPAAAAQKANKGLTASMRNLKKALMQNDLTQQLDESYLAKRCGWLEKDL